MAKPPKAFGSSKVKVRVFEFEMDGSNDSIQDAMKTLAAAISRGGQAVPVTRRIRPDSSTVLPGMAEADVDDETHEDEQGDGVQFEDAMVKPQPASRRPRKPPVVKILHDLKFTDAEPTLKAFYDAKNPGKNIVANYLVVAYWFKTYGGIEELTVDHFHTAFRHVGFNTPKNAVQPIRDLRNNRDGRMMGGTAPGTCIINHLGENYVNDMHKGGD